jgi:hypothetical protein
MTGKRCDPNSPVRRSVASHHAASIILPVFLCLFRHRSHGGNPGDVQRFPNTRVTLEFGIVCPEDVAVRMV